MAEPFAGFPREGVDFFEQLQRNNNREWFLAHKDVYERCCRAPMQALVAELEPRFGTTKISRINRDMRFSRDGAPYKTYVAAGVGGHYIALSANGLFVGAGLYKPDAPALQRLRASIADDTSGRELEALVKSLRRNGYDVASHETLASAPRGYTIDHPRIELLKMKDIYAGRTFEAAGWLSTPRARERIERVMTDTGALVAWLRQHVGAPSHGPRSRGRSRSATPARSHSRGSQTR
jgi:uncharacterized protein (TIGR02453 family)